MIAIPDVRYARSGDVAIAYQVVGDGPVDVVVSLFLGNLRWAWEQPLFVRFFERFASFSRLILFDKRGMGLCLRRPADDSRADARDPPGTET